VSFRELRKQDTALGRFWQALWPKLPQVAQKRLIKLEPKPAQLVRRAACEALFDMQTGAAEAVPTLIETLTDSDPQVKWTAIRTLGEIGPSASDALPELVRVFKGGFNPVPPGAAKLAAAASVALAQIAPADPLVFHLLKGALEEKAASANSSDLALATVSGLEQIAGAGHDIVSTLLATLSQAGASALRYRILSARGRIGQQPQSVVPVLIDALRSEDSALRSAAVESLGSFGAAAAPAVPTLILLARESLAQTRNRSQESLVQLRKRLGTSSTRQDGPELPTDPQPIGLFKRYGLLPEVDPMSSSLLRTLGSIGRPAKEAIPFLVEEYNQRENPARCEAAFARWQIDGDVQAVFPVLLEGIRHPVFHERSHMIPFLRRIGSEAVPVLLVAFRDTDSTVRATAVECLAKKIQPEALLDPVILKSGINDSNLSVRIAMIQGLGACGEKAAAAPLLKPLLNHSKHVIRKVATEALEKTAPAQTKNASVHESPPKP